MVGNCLISSFLTLSRTSVGADRPKTGSSAVELLGDGEQVVGHARHLLRPVVDHPRAGWREGK